jgi:ElaB/YqjD/DUF883 family membrane-anchored ribosome-binding protein
MDTSFNSNIANTGGSMVDKAADKLQSGIRDARHGATEAGAAIGSKVDGVANKAQQSVDSLAGKARRGLPALQDAVKEARDSVVDTSDSIISYTKGNPVKALMIAAASGALLWTLLKAFAPSRD